MSVIDLSKSTGQGSDRTVICRMHSKYPVRLMQQSHWIQSYITIVGLGFGGGLVQGDCTSLNILLRDGAEGCFKTQGSTKVFKCAYDKVCFQRVQCSVRDRSLLVYIPDPTVCFDDANYRQNIRLDVDNSSSLVFVDCFSSGRLGRDKFWGASSIHNSLSVYMDGNLVIHETQHLFHSTTGDIATKVGHFHVIGTILLMGERTAVTRKRLSVLQTRQHFKQKREALLIEEARSSKAVTESLVSVASIAGCPDGLIVRVMCSSMEGLYELLREVLGPLSQELPGLDAYSDRCLEVKTQDLSSSDAIYLLRAYDTTVGATRLNIAN